MGAHIGKKIGSDADTPRQKDRQRCGRPVYKILESSELVLFSPGATPFDGPPHTYRLSDAPSHRNPDPPAH